MIRLSASSIKDFLECPQRFWYRHNKPETKIESDHMILGSIIHEAIEKFDSEMTAVVWANEEWDKEVKNAFAEKVKKPPKNIDKLLGNYYNKIVPKLENVGVIKEEFFDVPWGYLGKEEIRLIGKMDRISGNSVYDWKSSSRRPSKYVLQDIQFYIYALAYDKLFNRLPDNIYYGHLYTGNLYDVELKDEMLYVTLPEIIIRVAEQHTLPPFRVTGFHCQWCIFNEICFNDMDNGDETWHGS